MSKPSLRLQLAKLLVFYHILLWQLGHWPQFKFHCRADQPQLLLPSEVSALSVFMSNVELRPEQIIGTTYCDDVVWTYGFVIECNCANTSACRITGIRMSYLGLTGTIHESVGDLTSLTYLILSNNTLHGGIPDTFGKLTNLRVLDLSRNQLNGSIPASFKNMVSLRWLYLQYNLLSRDIPRSFGSLKNLIELNLQFNTLSGSIPEDFGNLSSLKIMDLSENELSGPLPESLGKLKTLTTLYVSANNLSGKFPETFGNLTSLKKFSIAGNYISGPLPVETIANWTNIRQLVLVGNNFEGNLTEKIFRLQKLHYLWISDLANDGFELPPNISNSANFTSLILRNCSITGPIPEYIGQEMTSLTYLDLSFNKLTGGLPQNMSSNMSDMSFSGNMLNGTIPLWIFTALQTRMDLSFNNFSAIESAVPSNLQLNLFACCRNSSTTAPDLLYTMDPFEMKNRYCPENKSEYHSLYINCGGEETTFLGNKYDQDNATSLFYTSPNKNWAYSVSGGYGVPERNTSNYIKSMTRGVPITEAPLLYENARLSPVSLKYYAFCLREGNYTVTLYFNEVVYAKIEDYTSLRKRVFDIYIQDVRRLTYLKIRVKEGSTEGRINISAVVVNDSGLLNIHLYWPGKGSFQYLPSFNGPLISAISVTPEFKISSDKNNGQRVALITLASIVAALPLSLAYAWWMGWWPSEGEASGQAEIGDEQRNTKEIKTSQDQEETEIETSQDQEETGQSQEETGEEQRNKKDQGQSQEETGDEQRNKKDQGRRKNTKKYQEIETGQGQEETEIGQEEIGDKQKNTKDQVRRKNPYLIRNVQRDCKQEAANQSKFAIVEKGDTKKYGNKERQQQPQNVHRGKSSNKGSAVFGEGAAKFPWSNMRFPLEIGQEEIGEEQRNTKGEEEIGDDQEEIGDEERNTKGQEEIGDEQRNTKDQGRRNDPYPIGNVQQDCKQQEANQSKSAVVEEGDTKKYGSKERQQQLQSVRMGKSSDKGSAVFGEGAAKFPWSNMRFPLETEIGQEKIGDEHQDSEELPKIGQEKIGDDQEEIDDEQRNTKGQEEIGDEQRNTKDQGRRKNTETKRKKKEKIGDEHQDTVKELINATETHNLVSQDNLF